MRDTQQVFDALKAAPPFSVGVLSFAGYSFDQWVQILTVAWLLILILRTARDEVKLWRAKRRKRRTVSRRNVR